MIRKLNLYTKNLKDVTDKDSELVGREALTLAKLHSFQTKDFKLQEGFVISSIVFDDFLITNNIVDRFITILSKVEPFIESSAKDASSQIANLILTSPITDGVSKQIDTEYKALGIKDDEPIKISLSNIIESEFLTKKLRNNDVFTNVNGLAGIKNQLRYLWLELFSPEALELRANKYYKGAISVSVIATKRVKSEISGRVFSLPSVSKKLGNIEIQAQYGIWGKNSEANCDLYTVNLKSKRIEEKIIIPQDHMDVYGGGAHGFNLITVPISKAWTRRQKIEDEHIFKLTKILIELEKYFSDPVSFSWSLHAGEIYITDIVVEKKEDLIKELNFDADRDNELQRLIDNHILKAKQSKTNSVQKEVDSVIKENKADISHSILEEKKSELKLLKPKTIKLNTIIKSLNSRKEVNIKSKVMLDLSSLTADSLEVAKNFDGGYFDATNLIVNHGLLPEKIFEHKKDFNELVESYTIDIALLSKALDPMPLFYSFSNITEFELDLLGENRRTYLGDERFIEYPESIFAESMALKKAMHTNDCSNINLIIPSLRSLSNLKDIKEIISTNSIKRSKNLEVYAEVSVPSFLTSIKDVGLDLVDGVVINYQTLLKLYFYRHDIRKIDHDIMFDKISEFTGSLRAKNLKVVFKLDLPTDYILKDLASLKPDFYIFLNPPLSEELRIIKSFE